MDGEVAHITDDPTLNPRHKLRRNPITTAELERLYFEDGLPIKKIADQVGISHSVVANRLYAAGRALRKWHGGPVPKAPISEIVRLYFEEELSTNDIGAKFGLTGETVRKRLRAAGHKLRENVPARQMKAWRMNPIDRRKLFGGLGRAQQQALAKERNAKLRKKMPPGERLILDGLNRRGISDLIQQRAVGIYNMDFATGSIGIEVIGGRNKPQGFASSAERIYFILKSGFHLIELLYREPLDPLQEAGIDQIVAFLKLVETLPPSIREYRMIGGSGQPLAVFKVDVDDNA